jgi:platelet-activating factor acetylhydrolase IB subunit alpha
MIAYLDSMNMTESAAALRKETNLGENFDQATSKKYETLLEKKWTSFIRMQNKTMSLEARNAELQQEVDKLTPLSSQKVDPATWLPRVPAKYTFQGHRAEVTSVAFHPTFSSLASGCEDATIKIWDWELGELERTLKGHTKGVLDVDFGGPRGGTLLASCSSDLTIKLWDPSDEYKNTRTLPGHDHSISSIRFIPSGAAGAPLSGNTLVSVSRDQTVKIWDVTTGYCLKTLKGHSDWVRCVAASIDGRWLFTAGNDQVARLWDATSGDAKITFVGHDHVLEAVAIAPGSSYVHLATVSGYKKPPPASSSGEFLATGGRDKIIKLWDNRGTCHKTLVGHDNWIRGLLFHPAGRYLLSISDDKTIRCWDLSQDCKCVKVLEHSHDHFVTSIRWAPDVPVQTTTESNGKGLAVAKKDDGIGKIRCVIATGSVDTYVRVFAG